MKRQRSARAARKASACVKEMRCPARSGSTKGGNGMARAMVTRLRAWFLPFIVS